MTWFEELQPASYRGVPFAVLGGESRFGRRVAVHQYPMRDKPYVEDLGRSTRRISLTGFLVENSLVYGGGSAFAQRDAMVAAAEMAGPATLVHPTLGKITVSVPDGGLGVSEKWDQGRYFEISFTFIESGERLFPSVVPAITNQVTLLAGSLNTACGRDFLNAMTQPISLGLGIVEGAIDMGQNVIGRVVDAVAGYAVLAGDATRDATVISHLASLLTGNFGRYANGATTNAFQQSSNGGDSGATIVDAIAQATSQRGAVESAATAVQDSAANLDASSVSSFQLSVQQLLNALLTSIVDPADAVRLLGTLVTYSYSDYTGTGQVAQGRQIAEDAVSAFLRRCALAAMGQVVLRYQPTSYDDAAALRALVAAYLDDEILIAGDHGDDASYAALRALRVAIVNDLTTRGGSLAHLAYFRFPASLPSLMLAQRLYQDPTRADQLVTQVDPIHPAFMPTQFQALAN